MEIGDRRMMWHGMFLFLLGLLTGLFEQRFKNPRMALSAHLEGIMNGTLLMVLGAIWGHVRLQPQVRACARSTALYGAYSNWLFTGLGAALGTAAANPLVAAGYKGKPWQENLAKAGFLSVIVSIVTAAVLVVWGLGHRTSLAETSVSAPKLAG